MKRTVALFLILLSSTLCAQTGQASLNGTAAAKKTTELQNWVFATGALVAAAAGITFVIWSQGASPHHD
jgi:hypothetical protein